MAPRKTALSAIAVAPPDEDVNVVAAIVREEFGLAGKYTSLVSERDQNFHLRADDGNEYVVKVTSSLEASVVTNFQIGALSHLENDPSLALPRVVRALDGATSSSIDVGGSPCRLRVVTWVNGTPLEGKQWSVDLVTAFGAALARLDLALQGYSHPGEQPLLLWDLQRTSEVRDILHYIEDAAMQDRVASVIDDFDNRVASNADQLRSQVIHSDANPENVLLHDDGIGFIDFGDMVKAPLVYEIAIAASYLRSATPTEFIVPFVNAYQGQLPLEPMEIELLYDLVRARLATTISLMYWRLRERSSGDEYSQKLLGSENSAMDFLVVMDEEGRESFTAALR